MPADQPLAIVGGGPVGMLLALALARHGFAPLLLDSRAAGAWSGDPRALALAAGSRHLLERLGTWPAAAVTPIEEVHVSQRGGFGQTLLRAADHDLPALGYVVAYGDLCAALDRAVGAAGIEVRRDCPVQACRPDADGVTLTTADGECRAALVVHAEGAGDDCEVFDYRQDAILLHAEAAPPLAPRGRAWERFTADGPLALLPVGQGYAVVFVCHRDAADELFGLDDAAFRRQLEARLSGRLRFAALGRRSRIPLALRRRRQTVRGRELWIGNAAQSLHPVSGQGLNLGLRDAWELAETLAQAAAKADPATDPAATLAAFARARQVDRLGGIAFTDGIVRLFSNDLAPLRLARGLGLAALDLCPPARRFFAERMMFGTRR